MVFLDDVYLNNNPLTINTVITNARDSEIGSKLLDNNNPCNIPEKYPRVKFRGPHQEWIHAIKGEGPEPGSNFSYSAPMSEVALLGVLAQRFGGKIEWDSKNMKITNRPELNEFVQEPVRKGWEAGRDLWKA